MLMLSGCSVDALIVDLPPFLPPNVLSRCTWLYEYNYSKQVQIHNSHNLVGWGEEGEEVSGQTKV